MIRSIVTAAAAVAAATCMVAAATPAFASDATPNMTYDAHSQRFCTAPEALPGSNIWAPTCYSAADWAKMGLTVRFVPRVAQR